MLIIQLLGNTTRTHCRDLINFSKHFRLFAKSPDDWPSYRRLINEIIRKFHKSRQIINEPTCFPFDRWRVRYVSTVQPGPQTRMCVHILSTACNKFSRRYQRLRSRFPTRPECLSSGLLGSGTQRLTRFCHRSERVYFLFPGEKF